MSYIGQGLPADAFQGFTTDSFTGDGSATTFTLSKKPFSEDTLIVVINNVIQQPGTNFTVSGTTLTIVGTAVANGDPIYAIHMGGPLPIGEVNKLDLNGGSDQLILDEDADTTISADTDDQIDFKAGGTDIMSLTATTATINDGTTIITNDNSDTLTLQSADADASEGPVMVFDRASSSPADDDVLGAINFRGKDSGGNGVDYVKIRAEIMQESDGSEDGQLQFNIQKAGTSRNVFTIDRVETVFNEDGVDLDFRVETDNLTHALFVNAGEEGVYINNSIGAAYAHDSYNERFGITNPNNVYNMHLETGHASFSTYQVRGDCTRASTSAFGHIIFSTGNRSDNQYRLMGDGSVYSDGSNNLGSGADYAEFFEWKDGNASDEDRRGYSVVLDGNQIVKATDSDDASKIIGVISGMPGVIGDTHWDRWHNKYLRDDYGSYIFEDYTQTEWKNDIGNVESYQTDLIPDDVTVPDDAVVTSKDENGNNLQRRKLNPSFDASKTYVSREDRKEWGIVGLVGKLRLKKGQPTGTNWVKMRDISDTVEEWLIR